MAPRQAAKASNSEKEANPEQLEASRLQQQAYDSGVRQEPPFLLQQLHTLKDKADQTG